MSWFKVDDGFSDHPKVKRIMRRSRPAALGLWLAAGTWSARYLTDGIIPADVIRDNGDERLADALVSAGLWHGHGHGCPRCPNPGAGERIFHDWADYQPTKRAVEERRRVRAAAGAVGGVASGRVRRLRVAGDDQ